MSIFSSWFGAGTPDPYMVRKDKFIAELDERQREFHEMNKGASQTEVILVLEKRIHDLEHIVYSMRQIPTLVDVVLPDEVPVVEKVKKPKKKKKVLMADIVPAPEPVKAEKTVVEPLPQVTPSETTVWPYPSEPTIEMIPLELEEPVAEPAPAPKPKRIRKSRAKAK